jgi:uncharacterized protein
MEIEKSFRVEVSPRSVWQTLTDLSRVARCLPGADLTRLDANGVHHGTVQVKLGPAALSFRGRAEIHEADAEAHRLVVIASGSERRGRGTVRVRIVAVLADEDGGTRVDVTAVMDISGTVAQLGRRGGILEDVSEELIGRFIDELRAEIMSSGATKQPWAESMVVEPVAQPATADPGVEPAASAVRSASSSILNPRTGLWAHIPPPRPAPGSPAALDPAQATPEVVLPWPPPPATLTPATRRSGPAPTLSAREIAWKVLRRRIRRIAERVTIRRRASTQHDERTAS